MAAIGVTLPIASARRSRRGDLWRTLLLVFVGAFVAAPIVFLVLGSFSLAKLPTDLSLARLGLGNYVEVWLKQNIEVVFYNTIVYVGGATAVGVGFAALFAWLVERTNMPGKIWIYAGIPLTLAVPGLLQAIGWLLLLSPQSGFFNHWLMQTFHLAHAPFNVKSLGGMVFVEGLRLVPTAFLMLVPLLRSMDPSLEEAAAVSGARPLSMLRRVTIGLMAPGLFAVTVYQAMTALEVFEVPGILGFPANIHVFSTRVYAIVQNIATVPSFGQANALAMIYLLIAVVASYFYFRLISRTERFAVVTGKAYRPRLVDLGRWRIPFFALAVLFLFLSIVVPYLVLLYASLVGFLQQPSIAAFKTFSLRHYVDAIEYDRFQDTMWNTALMVVGTATVVTVVSFLVSLVVVRSKFWGRRLLDQLAFMPHAVPGIVLGLAFLWLFLKFDQFAGTTLFGTVTSIVIGFSVQFLAYGTRAMNGAILQLHRDLEEAAATSGAPPWRVMGRIFVPLMLPTIVGVWIYVVLLSVRLAGLPLMLFEGRDNTVLAVLIWYLWDEGHIEAVAAIGIMLMTVLFLLVIGLRLIGFGRDLTQAEAQTGTP